MQDDALSHLANSLLHYRGNSDCPGIGSLAGKYVLAAGHLEASQEGRNQRPAGTRCGARVGAREPDAEPERDSEPEQHVT